MGKITIIANNFYENASGSIRDDGGEILTQSGKTVVQNGGKGVNYDKNKDRKTPTDIRITKIEGPFDGNGKLTIKVVLGKSYTFKATPTRKPTIAEISLLKWSVKLDEGEKEIILGTASINKLEDGKIVIPLKINHDFKKAKIFAFYQKADDNVSVETKINDVFHPYTIAKSRHRKGMNEEGTAKHHDMISGDMTKEQMLKLNPMFSDEIESSEDKLIYNFRNLARTYSMGVLEDVNMRLIDRFIDKNGEEFEDKNLTYFAEKHESTTRFINNIKNNISNKLTLNPNFINNEEEVYFVVQDIEPKSNRKDIPSPSLGKNFIDKIGGLGIAVNDTWGYDVIISKFDIDVDKRRYSAILEIELFDHYGLDSLDVDPNEKPDFAKDSGFRSWFYLQHSKKYQFTPFITIMKFKKHIYGKY